MLNHSFIFDMIQHYIPRHMRKRSPFTEALVDALSHTGYNRLGEEFANTYFHQDSYMKLFSFSFLFLGGNRALLIGSEH